MRAFGSGPARMRKGVVLIFVAGILTILAAMGTAFYATTHSSSLSAVRYADMVRADLLARAGLNDAVARLRVQTFLAGESPTDAWYTTDWLHGADSRSSYAFGNGLDDDGDGITDNEPGETKKPYVRLLGQTVGEGSDRYSLEIEDAASKINVNACDNLGVLLDNLCRLIGFPLVAADQQMLQPRRWYVESGSSLVEYNHNAGDTPTEEARDLYFTRGTDGRPIRRANGTAVYGDGYAIAGYRARNGRFSSSEDIKNALTYVERNGNGLADDPLEVLEIEAKFAALRPHLTTDSWVDPNTVCVGKFEWVTSGTVDAVRRPPDTPNTTAVNPLTGATVSLYNQQDLETGTIPVQFLVDRDKSWVADDPINDPLNQRGSLRGCYVSIMNGHGAGQLRRIATNGADWIAIRSYDPDEQMRIPPGPISSYMIISREDALLEKVASSCGADAYLPATWADGRLVDDPNIDYVARPLCIFRAPVNINTASDKVLAATLMGLNVQHGHPLALGTDADLDATSAAWKITPDPNGCEGELLTFQGLKRVPVSPGQLFFDTGRTIEEILPNELKSTGTYDLRYITNYGAIGLNEAHVLAARIISARQRTRQDPDDYDPDPFTDNGSAGTGYNRGLFLSWDDLYFRVIKPWDDLRSKLPTDTVLRSGVPLKGGQGKQSIARMLMAAVNPNTDLLKFNPNIEWIDRWGRNFTEMEPVMIYTNDTGTNGHADTSGNVNTSVTASNPLAPGCEPIFAREDGKTIPGYEWVTIYLCDFRNRDQGFQLPNGNAYRGGAYIVRSQRYKSDELIDKTDLNRSTTEFSFHSNGIFHIVSAGQIVHNETQQLLAERKLEAVVKVYDMWRESTQADFVQGEFMEAAGGNNGSLASLAFSHDEANRSGKVTRDGVHTGSGVAKPVKRLALNTQPEPLVPLTFRLTHPSGNEDKVDVNMRDAWGNPRVNPWDDTCPEAQVPDVLANRVLPARYDGQLMLAVNTPRFDQAGEKDTFLATFTGDLDTQTSAINGREQSKMPHTAANDGYRYRVVDTFGLLGLLNDTLVDLDPDLPDRYVYCFSSANTALVGLDTQHYYNNCSVRMGDLRPDGVFLSNTGVSGNDGTLKYCFSQSESSNDKSNFNPNDPEGFTISMWAKTTWWEGDNRRHEFFNASNPGWGPNCRACFITKDGRYYFTSNDENGNISMQGQRRNDLTFLLECPSTQHRDIEYGCLLHGDSRVDYEWRPPHTGRYKPRLKPDGTLSAVPESSSYYVQPFRWCFLGGRASVKDNTMLDLGPGSQGLGRWKSDRDVQSRNRVTQVIRSFVNTSLLTEKGENHTNWSATQAAYADLAWTMKDSRWWDAASPGMCDIGNAGPADHTQQEGQGAKTGLDAAFDWADIHPSKTASAQTKVFAINNLNYGRSKAATGDQFGMWQYRQLPDEGTYAVIDALKISGKANLDLPNSDRVLTELTTSRYYLPDHPGDRSECPWFISQTLSQFTRGSASVSQYVTPVRVTWSGFSPRFYYEERQASGSYRRDELMSWDYGASRTTEPFKFKGPFDHKLYNDDDATVDYSLDGNGRRKAHVSVERPSPADYRDHHKARKDAFEVELLKDNGGTIEVLERLDGLNNHIFDDPCALNALKPVRLPANQLRYRVRFRYYRDPLVDPAASADGSGTVDDSVYYLLDTPVFDDISITYFTQVRFLGFRPVNE